MAWLDLIALAAAEIGHEPSMCQAFVDLVSRLILHHKAMIRSFRSRGLSAFWHQGDLSGIRPDLAGRIRLRLDALNAADRPDALNLPGFNFHRLRGKPVRYTIHVNGPWCVTFEWDDENAIRVDLEQYH